MAISRIKTDGIQDEAVTSAKIGDNIDLDGQFVRVPHGTTAQRPSSPASGYLRFNTTLGTLEQWNTNTNAWAAIDSPPIITSLAYTGSATAVDPAGGETITVTGTNFKSGAIITVDGTTAPTVSFVSSTTLTFTTPAKTAGDYDVVVTNPNGLAATLTAGISYNGIPTWTTSAGSLGDISGGETMSTITVVASEPDGGTIGYSITSGALPAGVSLGSANGQLTGTPTAPTATTTSNFTITATDDETQTTGRAFSLTVLRPVDAYSLGSSIMLDDSQSAKLERSFNGSGDRTQWTVSFWVKRTKSQTARILYTRNSTGQDQGGIYFANNKLQYFDRTGNVNQGNVTTTEIFRDFDKYYHVVASLDASNQQFKFYVNGVEKTLTTTTAIANATHSLFRSGVTAIGYEPNASDYHAGNLSEFIVVEGQVLDQTAFGEFYNGVWVAKEYTGTFGSNYGFHLDFANSSDIGNDVSGNSNHMTTVTGIGSEDVHKDEPSNVFASIVPSKDMTDDRGNLRLSTSRTSVWDATFANIGVRSGKWYYEARLNVGNSDNFRNVLGWDIDIERVGTGTPMYNHVGTSSDPFSSVLSTNYLYASWNSAYYKEGGTNGTSVSSSDGDVFMCAADFDNNKIWFGINGTWYANDGGSDGNPAAGTNESLTMQSIGEGKHAHPVFFLRSDGTTGSNTLFLNFGQDSSFNNAETSGQEATDSNGYGEFHYTPPTGFLALCSKNLKFQATFDHLSAASNPNRHFEVAKYIGNGTSLDITGVNFKPGVGYFRNYTVGRNSEFYDDIDGPTSSQGSWRLSSSVTTVGQQATNGVTSFNSDGLSLGTKNNVNESGVGHIAYLWNMGTSNVTNSEGTISSTIRVNTTAGQGMARYTGTGSNATWGHGLDKAPEWMIINNLTDNSTVIGYHKDVGSVNGGDYYLVGNPTGGSTSAAAVFNSTPPTDTLVHVGTNNATNGASDYHVAYYWHSVDGYSKFGRYNGNADSDGPYIYLGFKPAFFYLKRLTGNWGMVWDKERHLNGSTSNDNGFIIFEEDTAANNGGATLGDYIDILPNGVKIRSSGSALGQQAVYIYAAFAEHPSYVSKG
jgi:hypothetical protein